MENEKNSADLMKFNPQSHFGLVEAYSSIMNQYVREILACNEDTLPQLLEHMGTTYTDEFIIECVRVSEYLRRKIYK